MRVKLTRSNLDKLFGAVFKKGRNWSKIAAGQKVTTRTLRDWRNGSLTLPKSAFESFLKASLLEEKILSPKFLLDRWHIRAAAKKGAIRRMEIYGNLGTPEGRRKGGIASLKAHYKRNTGFVILKKIKNPGYCALLAELLGILIGDGHLSEYQIGVTTNSITDLKHAHFVKELFYDLFRVKSKISLRKEENSVNIVASSRSLVRFLNKHGMPVGNKINKGLNAPRWVLQRPAFQKAFIRGLFDTDGCIYIDKHRVKNKTYFHGGWTITSYADTLRQDVLQILEKLGFSPTCRDSQKSVYLRKQENIHRYFEDIGTNNPKHRSRYQQLIGGVPKWS